MSPKAARKKKDYERTPWVDTGRGGKSDNGKTTQNIAANNGGRGASDRSSKRSRGAEARATEKRGVAVRRQELLSGLSADDKREVAAFMGSVNTKTRNTLQEIVRLLASSGRDSRFLVKRILVHALVHLDADRCIFFLEMMLRQGQEATLQLLWLYERYNVPNGGGGGMTKCQADHFGRDKGLGKIEEIFCMPEADQGDLARQLAAWDPAKKIKVMKAWEATDPAMTATFLLGLIREEQGRGAGSGNLWQCSLCPIKREVEVEERLKRGEHRRKDRLVDAGALYDYRSERRGGTVLFRSPHESLFEFRDCRGDYASSDSGTSRNEVAVSITRDVTASGSPSPRTTVDETSVRAPPTPSFPRLTYAGHDFDGRRLCNTCTQELRGTVIADGYDMELWHAVDHERRALHQAQRQHDVFKARWAERERGDRQISELLRFICEANLAASSRATLEARANAANDAHTTSIRRTLNLKLWDQNAVRVGARKDQCLKLLNVREAEENARMLRLKAQLNIGRHYALLELGSIPPSSRRRHAASSKPADFLNDGTPATAWGAIQTFGRAEPVYDDESADIRCWKEGAKEAEEKLDRRREVREWQSARGRQARFSFLCQRWLDAASSIEDRQRQKRMVEATEREKRAHDREAAKLQRKQQLENLRARAMSRATGDNRRQEEKDREGETRRMREAEELKRMRIEEGMQLAAGDRFWGLIIEMQRLRDIEEKRRLLWEARIRATREKMVSVRCISGESSFSHTIPPTDPELAQKIARLAAI